MQSLAKRSECSFAVNKKKNKSFGNWRATTSLSRCAFFCCRYFDCGTGEPWWRSHSTADRPPVWLLLAGDAVSQVCLCVCCEVLWHVAFANLFVLFETSNLSFTVLHSFCALCLSRGSLCAILLEQQQNGSTSFSFSFSYSYPHDPRFRCFFTLLLLLFIPPSASFTWLENARLRQWVKWTTRARSTRREHASSLSLRTLSIITILLRHSSSFSSRCCTVVADTKSKPASIARGARHFIKTVRLFSSSPLQVFFCCCCNCCVLSFLGQHTH